MKTHIMEGIYCKETVKEKILESLDKLIHRIRIKYRDPIVTVYGDFNTT